jgi:hypothetical protein
MAVILAIRPNAADSGFGDTKLAGTKVVFELTAVLSDDYTNARATIKVPDLNSTARHLGNAVKNVHSVFPSVG